jgi:hypothetical protein
MAQLADDWKEQRHTCVDVLVALLRLPWLKNDFGTDGQDSSQAAISRRADLEVRRTVLRVLGEHLKESHDQNWSAFPIDLRECELPDFVWDDPTFHAPLLLSDAVFQGKTTIHRPRFLSDTSFDELVINGSLSIEEVECGPNATLSFTECVVNGGFILGLSNVPSQLIVALSNTVVNGGFQLRLLPSMDKQGRIDVKDMVNNGLFSIKRGDVVVTRASA